MKAIEKKQIEQTFEFELAEVIECFSNYLKIKNVTIPDKAIFAFEIKVNPTSRELEKVKLSTKSLEEGPCAAQPTASNGKGQE